MEWSGVYYSKFPAIQPQSLIDGAVRGIRTKNICKEFKLEKAITYFSRQLKFRLFADGRLLQMAGLQFNLEDRSKMDRKYKNQIQNLQAKISNADARFTRDEETLLKIKDKMHRIEEHRKKKEEEAKKKKK